MADGGKKLSEITNACTAPVTTDRLVMTSNVGPQAQTAYVTIQSLFSNTAAVWFDVDYLYVRVSNTVVKKVALESL